VNTLHQPETITNPFCSRRVRPGATAYLFPSGQGPAHLVDQLRQNAWWGQIVGPHGSGKSALLAALLPAIERAGRRTLLIELHDGRRRLPQDFRRAADSDCPTLVVVDGYEQLGLWQRWWLKRFCRRRGLGLLLTAHAPVGLPELAHTSATPELAQQIVAQLQGHHPSRITPADVTQRFGDHGGNLREMLFDLYDLYEQRRPAAEGQTWQQGKP
jgi:hypothetical protein